MRHKKSDSVLFRCILCCLWTIIVAMGFLMPVASAKPSPRHRAIELVKEAASAYNRGHYKRAVDYCKAATDSYSTYARAYVWMGASYQKLGNKREAIFAYKWVVALAPSSRDAARARRGLRELGYYNKSSRRSLKR